MNYKRLLTALADEIGTTGGKIAALRLTMSHDKLKSMTSLKRDSSRLQYAVDTRALAMKANKLHRLFFQVYQHSLTERPMGFDPKQFVTCVEDVAAGKLIYIPTAWYIDRGEDDVRGGIATVEFVEHNLRLTTDHPNRIFVTVKEVPGTGYNLKSLLRQQDELRTKFGNQKAKPDPDIIPWI